MKRGERRWRTSQVRGRTRADLDSPEAWVLGGVVSTAGKLRCFHLEGKRGGGPGAVWEVRTEASV